MKRAPISYRPSPWDEKTRERICEIEREFHVREFGEELARVNLDMTIEERRAYIDWMRKAAKEGKAKNAS
jgi:hypothetical protein